MHIPRVFLAKHAMTGALLTLGLAVPPRAAGAQHVGSQPATAPVGRPNSGTPRRRAPLERTGCRSAARRIQGGWMAKGRLHFCSTADSLRLAGAIGAGTARADLRNLVTMQEIFFSDSGHYAASGEVVRHAGIYQPSEGATVTVTPLDSLSYEASVAVPAQASLPDLPGISAAAARCTIRVGPHELGLMACGPVPTTGPR